jgi:cytochrome c oxidase subunit 4
MSHASAEDIGKHVKVYIMVFAALAVLTVVTVSASYLHLSVPKAIALAMLIASIKGSLVAAYFMHLISERKLLYAILVLCAIFFAALMLLPVVTTHEMVGSHVP